MTARTDVVIAGAGPAGRALAVACAERGLSVAVVAPDHEAPWRNTYGIWSDELGPLGLEDVLAARWTVTVARGERGVFRLARPYGVVDNERLAMRLRERLAAAGGREVTGSVGGAMPGRALLDDGREIDAGVVVDATGHRPALLRWAGEPVAYQSAYGIVATCSSPPAEPGAMTLMDFRHSPLGAVSEPTFLYAMDLGGDRWFVQETSLARHEPMPFERLESRLRRRLDALGVRLSDEGAVERCVFPMGAPLPEPQDVLGFGAAAGMVHPATGYQVGAALSRAPEVADALATAMAAGDGAQAAERAWTALWTPDRRRQRALHQRGLAALLRFDAARFERFFSAFFSLPEARWRAYISDARSAADVRRTMLAVLGRASGLRGALVSAAVRR